MADEVSDVNIEKGVHLSVVVEFSDQKIIVVCFKNKGKEFRGVLLESDGGFFPFSFPFLKPHPHPCPSIKSPVNSGSSSCLAKDGSSPPPDCDNKANPQTPEGPATTNRFSYNNDPFLVNTTPTPQLTVVEMKPIAPRSKTIRDIRLRPRQTLCSNCKSAIHEGRKTRSNSTHSLSNQSNNTTSTTATSSDSRLRPRVNRTVSNISPRPPKRKNETQTPMVLLEDIKHKSTRFTVSKEHKRNGNAGAAENEPSHNKSNFESSVESLTNTTNRLRANRRSLLSETNNINHEANIQLNCVTKDDVADPVALKSVKKAKVPNHEPSSKPSPAIKISIKGGAILKIPPRLPDSGAPLADNVSEADKGNHIDDMINSQIHKKAKKSAKRAKDRHRMFDGDSAFSTHPNGDQALTKSIKKHKKKHRHRHSSPQPVEVAKTLSHVLHDSNSIAFNKEANELDGRRESPSVTTFMSKQSKDIDTFPMETNTINTLHKGSNITYSIKQEEPNSINTFRSEGNSESFSRDSVCVSANVSFSPTRTLHNANTFRQQMSYSMNTSFPSGNNNMSTFSRETSDINLNGPNIGEADNMSVFRKTHSGLNPFTTHYNATNNYLNFDGRRSVNQDLSSPDVSRRDTYTPVENNNVAVKAEESVSIPTPVGYSDSNFSSSEGNFRDVSSPMQQKQIRVGDCFIDVVDISDSDSENESQSNLTSSLANPTTPTNSRNPPLNNNDELDSSRPRLLYTWSQDQGLSRVESNNPHPPSHISTPLAPPPQPPSSLQSRTCLPPPPPPPLVPAPPITQPDDASPRYLVKTSPNVLPANTNSPHRRKNASPGRVINAPSSNVSSFSTNSPLIKDYPLRNRTGSLSTQPTDLLMIAEHGGIVSVSEDSQSHSSGLESRFSDISGESDDEENPLEDIFAPCGDESISPYEDDKDLSKPLMLKIQTQNVTECVLNEGRKISVGDIVWGKIQGFPWWPGRVSGITVTQTQRDNNIVMDQLAKVAWFGSNTMSHVHCCDLDPFLEFFKSRYNKKKKGPYKIAIKQATQAAHKRANGSISHAGDILDFTD